MAEVDFPTTPPEEILRAFRADGSVLLRRFARPEWLDELHADVCSFYKACGGDDDEIHRPHIYPADLAKIQQRQFHEYIFDDRQYDLLSLMFGDFGYFVSPHTVTRRVRPSAENHVPHHQPPLVPHLDTFFHGFNFTVNFWVPFQPCGDDRPSLGVVRAPIPEIIAFTEYDGGVNVDPDSGWCFSRFRPEMLKLQHNDPDLLGWLESNFGDRVWTPKYEYGDAMMISNWTLHFTHSHAGMTAQRENVELRFQCMAGWGDVLASQGKALPEHARFRGGLHGYDGRSLSGWAADAGSDEQVTVEFFQIDNDGRRTRLGSTQTDRQHGGLQVGGAERPGRGFTWLVPPAEKEMRLTARFAETGAELPGSPIVVSPGPRAGPRSRGSRWPRFSGWGARTGR